MKTLFEAYTLSNSNVDPTAGYITTINNFWENPTDQSTAHRNLYYTTNRDNISQLKIIDNDTSKIYNIHSQNIRTTEPSDFRVEIPKLVKNVISYLYSEEYEDGEVSKTHLYLESLYNKNQMQFRDVFQQVWLKLYSQDSNGLRDFICISAGLDYEWLLDRADALVLGAFLHSDENVNEAGIRAVESWGTPEHSDLLKNTRPFADAYLEEYRQSVITNLRASS